MKPARAFLFFMVILSLFIGISLLTGQGGKETDIFSEEHQLSPKIVPRGIEMPSLQDDSSLIPGTATSKKRKLSGERQACPGHFIYAPDDSVHLEKLVAKLENIRGEKLPVRILYFGDSQIENDRITSVLREKLQDRFGGKGPGFVPLDEYYNPFHQLIINLSDTWIIHSFQDEGMANSGLLFRNTLLTGKNQGAWFRISRLKQFHPKPDFNILKLFYTSCDSCAFQVKESSKKIYSGVLPPAHTPKIIDFKFSSTPENIRVHFFPIDSISVLGLSLESPSGILVDNISLRGLSYPAFTSSNSMLIREMLDQINPGLFIFHFGVNLIPYPSKDYAYFRKQFKKQILFLKKYCPEVPLLIIGVSDMAQKKNGKIFSYSNISRIKQIQKEIAKETGSVFWDLEAFMGGPGSMVKWVNARPPLGRTDYAHFTSAGAKKVGTELGRILLEEIDKSRSIKWKN